MAARWDYFMAADTQRISKPFHLVIEGACPDMGVVGEAGREVFPVTLKLFLFQSLFRRLKLEKWRKP